MAQLTPHVQEFSDQELAAMRQEVLRWIEQHGRPQEPTPSDGEPKAGPQKSARRTVRRTSKAAPKPAVVPVAAAVAPQGTAPHRSVRAVTTVASPRSEPAAVVAPQRVALPQAGRVLVRRVLARQRPWVLTALAAAAGGSGAIVVSLVGIYGWGWSGNFSRGLAGVLPLPAAYAGGAMLSLDDFFQDVDVMTTVYRSSGKPRESSAVRAAVVARFSDQVALRRLAQRSGVTVPEAEVEGALQYLISQAGSAAAFEQQVAATFPRWTIGDFRSKLLAPYILRQAVFQKLFGAAGTWEAAEQQAKKIRQMIRSGETSFAQAAAQFNPAGSGAPDGDIGYRGLADLEENVYAQLVRLERGEVSEPIRTARGYSLMQPVERFGEPDQVQFRLREILILPAVNLEELVAREQGLMGVKRLVP